MQRMWNEMAFNVRSFYISKLKIKILLLHILLKEYAVA
jgi:hypothetical protein